MQISVCYSLFFHIFAPEMLQKAKRVARTLSFRLSLMVIAALAMLLMVALLVLLFFSRKAVKELALRDAEQTLEATVHNIDNILLSVEQASGNVYWKIYRSIQTGDGKEEIYARKLVETNPYISDCRLVWETESREPGDSIPGAEYMALWTVSGKEDNASGNAVASFRLPIFVGQKRICMMVMDVSLTLLSKIVLEAKPSPNSYCTLLASDGSYIVHPDSIKLSSNVFGLVNNHADPSVKDAASAMVSGGTGYRYVRLAGEDYYVFYKPFERASVPGRAMADLGWSAGIIYPEDDIFGDYNRLIPIVLIIAIVSLALLLGLCYAFIHRQFLPLRKLAVSAQRIADGYYDERIPEVRRRDEIGRLENHFIEMQQSLSTRMGEMQRLTDTLNQRGKVLQAAYEQAQVGESMKTNFLYNMSDQMMSPIDGIRKSVNTLCDRYSGLTEEDVNRLVEDIRLRGERVTELLNQLIKDSEKYE